jgi:hypothetical protein
MHARTHAQVVYANDGKLSPARRVRRPPENTKVHPPPLMPYNATRYKGLALSS